ncbi:MAG: hypothetical protein V7L05_01875 [Nostoc sp.]|uniref:hypothetical protein n=1 Tax=Nostoc sp. TaxID=1180 RepID=UPI002FF9F87F
MLNRQWLYWYDEQGERFLTPEEQMKQAQQEAQQAQQELRRVQRLRSLGVDPDSLT